VFVRLSELKATLRHGFRQTSLGAIQGVSPGRAGIGVELQASFQLLHASMLPRSSAGDPGSIWSRQM